MRRGLQSLQRMERELHSSPEGGKFGELFGVRTELWRITVNPHSVCVCVLLDAGLFAQRRVFD